MNNNGCKLKKFEFDLIVTGGKILGFELQILEGMKRSKFQLQNQLTAKL